VFVLAETVVHCSARRTLIARLICSNSSRKEEEERKEKEM
jgi:hypothetical protein